MYHRKYGLNVQAFLILLDTIRKKYELSSKVKSPAIETEMHDSTDEDDYTSSDEEQDNKPEKWVSIVYTPLSLSLSLSLQISIKLLRSRDILATISPLNNYSQLHYVCINV